MMPDLDRLMPDLDPRNERVKQRVRVGLCIAMGATTVLLLIRPGWTWVPVAFVTAVSVLVAVGAGGGPSGGRRRDGGPRGRGRDAHGKGSGLSGGGRDDDDGPAGVAGYRWHALVIVSRLMPRSAGRRWLAEAESLLSEITPARRDAAIRSYLLSAPLLVVMTWARGHASPGRASRPER
jgi:hypothetical protein